MRLRELKDLFEPVMCPEERKVGLDDPRWQEDLDVDGDPRSILSFAGLGPLELRVVVVVLEEDIVDRLVVVHHAPFCRTGLLILDVDRGRPPELVAIGHRNRWKTEPAYAARE